MNSTELQKKFPEAYKEFFSKSDLVMSGCLSFPWGPRSTWDAQNRLILKSCLPVRCYIGIKERKDKNIVFEDLVMYTWSEKGFETIPTPIIFKEIDKIIVPIQDFLSEKWIWKGYSIYILSEIWKGHSLGLTGTFSTVLTAIFLLLSKDIPESILENQKSFMFSKEKEQIFRLAWQWELLLRKGRTLWQTIMHTLYGQSSPALFTLETSSEIITPEQVPSTPVHFSLFENFIPEYTGTFEIPFEYALIFSGTISETFKIEWFREADIRNSNSLMDFVQNKIFPNIPTKDLYYKELLKNNRPYTYFSDAIGILNVATIKMFYKLFLSGYNKTLVEEFFDHMNHIRELLSIIEPQGDFANEFLNTFRQERKNPEEVIGILPMYSWKLGWGYLVCLKPGISRETLANTCEKMRECYPKIEIDYFSPVDGDNSSWIKIEQNIHSSQFSAFVSKWQVRYVDNAGKSNIWDYKAILDEKREGILFDSIARKIYFNNERLTSADVPSQTTLTDIMNILIDQIGEDVENNKFPLSSYMKNKNEMLGKIVIPLTRFLEKKTGMVLPMVCKGELGSFYLKLDPTSLSIGVIRKL